MEAVLRAVGIYVFLLILFRVSGKRTVAQITTFDLLLLLIIGEATQQGLIGSDYSVTQALVVVTTLVGAEVLLAAVQERFPGFGKVVEGLPVVLVERGKPIAERMRKSRVSELDIMERARQLQGLERMSQIKYAVLERDGSISIVPA